MKCRKCSNILDDDVIVPIIDEHIKKTITLKELYLFIREYLEDEKGFVFVGAAFVSESGGELRIYMDYDKDRVINLTEDEYEEIGNTIKDLDGAFYGAQITLSTKELQ